MYLCLNNYVSSISKYVPHKKFRLTHSFYFSVQQLIIFLVVLATATAHIDIFHFLKYNLKNNILSKIIWWGIFILLLFKFVIKNEGRKELKEGRERREDVREAGREERMKKGRRETGKQGGRKGSGFSQGHSHIPINLGL